MRKIVHIIIINLKLFNNFAYFNFGYLLILINFYSGSYLLLRSFFYIIYISIKDVISNCYSIKELHDPLSIKFQSKFRL